MQKAHARGPASPSLDALLTQSAWLRRLAGTLVRGEAAADDLVQETWLAVLRHPPRDARFPRAWLARIVRNLAANRRRAETRRGEHEADAAGPGTSFDPAPFDPARAAQAVEMQRLLAEAVLRLDEPLRSVVVLRYLQGLDSRASGARLGIAAGTVRWRLKRALEELRADLDARFGDRERWCSALLLLAPAEAARLTGAGSSTALSGTALVAAGGLLVGAVLLLRTTTGAELRGVEPLVAAEGGLAVETAALAEPLGLPPRPLEPRSAPVDVRRDSTPPPAPPTAELRAPIRGQLRLVDPYRRPAPGEALPPLDEALRLELRAADLSVRESLVSAPDGSFRTRGSFPAGFVLVRVLRPAGDPAGDPEVRFDPGATAPLDVPVNWPNALRGRLLDALDRPLVDASVLFTPLDALAPVKEVEVGAEGRFSIAGLPLGRCRVEIVCGFERDERVVQVARGPNELGELRLGFHGSGGEIGGRITGLDGTEFVLLVLTDAAGGSSTRLAVSLDGETEFRFPRVPSGAYRLDVIPFEGTRFEPASLEVTAPRTDLRIRATGAGEPLSLRARAGGRRIEGVTLVRVRGQWVFDAAPPWEDIEEWILLANDCRPVREGRPEEASLDVPLVPGWGGVFLFSEGGGIDSVIGAPVSGVQVRLDGTTVATSDASGIAVVDFAQEPEGTWTVHKPGWHTVDPHFGPGFDPVRLVRE